MALLEPYAPCPCGSGEKYKWCCQKVEATADRAARFSENGQVEPALGALEEGLRKFPNNPWLALLRAIYQVRRGEVEQAEAGLSKVAEATPKHVGIQSMLVRLSGQLGGPPAGAARLQKALAVLSPEERGGLAETAEVLGALMVDHGLVPGGLAHLELAEALEDDEPEARADSILRVVEAGREYSPWLRNPYELASTPEGLDPAQARRFEAALELADRALWGEAAVAFEALAKGSIPEADQNLGLCRLFLGDHPGAIEALRRPMKQVEPTPETVDLEVLCQLLEPIAEADSVELVQWIWPIRGREALQAAVEADDRTTSNGKAPLDPDDPESPQADSYYLLDRPNLPKGATGDPPRIEARLLIAEQYAIIEGYDDGRLDRLAERFRAIAGDAITPAHPRTKVLGISSKLGLAMRISLLMPEGAAPVDSNRMLLEEQRRLVRDVWPEIPQQALGNRTPRQAAASGDAELALRASLYQLEFSVDLDSDGPASEFHTLRDALKIEPEPEIDPARVEIDEVHLARLHQVPIDRLDDDRLVELFRKARRYRMARASRRIDRELINRPHLLDREEGPALFTVYGDLAQFALAREGLPAALEWLRKGREAQDPARRGLDAPHWDIFEVRLRARVESPEKWIPDLAAVLEAHEGDRAGQIFLATLIEMGLMRLVPNPDAPEEMLLDSRIFQALMARYGPKITTSGGRLGVSASKGGVWTPEKAAGGPQGGGIWTPGQPNAPSESQGGSKLYIPGR